jgi:hypothetical protein
MTIVIQHDNFFFAHQKVPVAPDAVVEPGLAAKQGANGERSDRKVMPKLPVVLLGSEEAVATEFHEKP